MNIHVFALVLLPITAVFGAPTDSDGSNSEDTKSPPNEWGPYYDLPADRADMKILFTNVLSDYVRAHHMADYMCETQDALFERWFRSSINTDHYILSFYCRTRGFRGYSHFKVEATSKHEGRVLEYQSSLKSFGIMDARGYDEEQTKDGINATRKQNELLKKVRDQIKMQPGEDPTKELCPDVGNKTVKTLVWTKFENGLYYYKFPVSCNISYSDLSTGGDYVTRIEVVEDTDFKVLNGGKATLVVMEKPEPNTNYIKMMEKELAAKQAAVTTNEPNSDINLMS